MGLRDDVGAVSLDPEPLAHPEESVDEALSDRFLGGGVVRVVRRGLEGDPLRVGDGGLSYLYFVADVHTDARAGVAVDPDHSFAVVARPHLRDRHPVALDYHRITAQNAEFALDARGEAGDTPSGIALSSALDANLDDTVTGSHIPR